MDFLKITNEILDNIDLSSYSEEIKSLEYREYFMSKSGQEHYRLLAHISQSENLINILDVGTLKGCSALAFSINKSNNTHSFNISNQLDLNNEPSNVTFIIDDILNGGYDDVILNSKYIMLDTYHEGEYERKFVQHLRTINYKGILLLDDIHLNFEMKKFWESISEEKYDISNVGHITGTGVVHFT